MRRSSRFDRLSKQILPILLPVGVERVGVFGSFSRNEIKKNSDIDILVKLKPVDQRKPLGLKWFSIERELSKLLGRSVDLVSEAAVSRHMLPYIQKDLVILYEAK